MRAFDGRTRLLIASEAARLIVDEGMKDYLMAKKKAAEHLHVNAKTDLPTNEEIELAVVDRQRLFGGDEQDELTRQLRELALLWMQRLEQFRPRLVGSVLRGTATEFSDINLHVFADSVEEVLWMLMENNMNPRSTEKRYRIQGRLVQVPGLKFDMEGIEIDLVVFTEDGVRQAPPSPIDGKPMKRANIKQVRALLDEDRALSAG